MENEKIIKDLKTDILKSFDEKIETALKGFVKPDDMEDALKIVKEDFHTSIEGMDKEEFTKYKDLVDKLKEDLLTSEEVDKKVTEANKEIKEIVKDQATRIDTLKAPQISAARKDLSRSEQFEVLVKNAFCSKEFEEFEKRGYRGSSVKMTLDNDAEGKFQLIETEVGENKKVNTDKAVVPITDHTGTVMISEISDIIRDDTPARKRHVRDLLNVGMTDQAQIVAGQVYSYTDALTLGATVLAENADAPESVFKSKENTWGVKRIANTMLLSKRWFRTNGLQWVIDYVLARLPDSTLTVEDFELLFGDGSGNHVFGISDVAQAFDLTPQVYTATAFYSVATWNGGTQALITFNAAHGMRNGDSLTIANATDITYNTTHTAVEVVNGLSVIIDLTYGAESLANVAAWTGSTQSIFYHAIDNAQEYDVLAVSEGLLEADHFNVTGHVVNPQQAIQMGLLKATDANYLNIQRDANGRVTGVNGLPIAVTTAVPTGKFFTGDFSRTGSELKEYTPLNIQFIEDTTTAKANEIMLLIEEEIIFPIYNPYAYIYGKFSSAKTELETPAS